MKRQYLGDAKDAFKWDYLDFLTRELKIQLLNILLMLTPDDDSKQGKSNPRLFPAPTIWPFCEELRKGRDFGLLRGLPERVDAGGHAAPPYEVRLHSGESFFVNSDEQRAEYFSGLPQDTAQVVFLDPDVGFEPPQEKSVNKKHVKFSDVRRILGDISQDSLVVAFQHAKHAGAKGKGKYLHLPFSEHYDEIRERLPLGDSHFATAIFWCNEVMFVILGESAQIEKVRRINLAYQKLPRPVQTLD